MENIIKRKNHKNLVLSLFDIFFLQLSYRGLCGGEYHRKGEQEGRTPATIAAGSASTLKQTGTNLYPKKKMENCKMYIVQGYKYQDQSPRGAQVFFG